MDFGWAHPWTGHLEAEQPWRTAPRNPCVQPALCRGVDLRVVSCLKLCGARDGINAIDFVYKNRAEIVQDGRFGEGRLNQSPEFRIETVLL